MCSLFFVPFGRTHPKNTVACCVCPSVGTGTRWKPPPIDWLGWKGSGASWVLCRIACDHEALWNALQAAWLHMVRLHTRTPTTPCGPADCQPAGTKGAERSRRAACYASAVWTLRLAEATGGIRLWVPLRAVRVPPPALHSLGVCTERQVWAVRRLRARKSGTWRANGAGRAAAQCAPLSLYWMGKQAGLGCLIRDYIQLRFEMLGVVEPRTQY